MRRRASRWRPRGSSAGRSRRGHQRWTPSSVESVRGLRHLALQVGVGQGRGCHLAHPSKWIATRSPLPGRDVTVDAVDGDVERAIRRTSARRARPTSRASGSTACSHCRRSGLLVPEPEPVARPRPRTSTRSALAWAANAAVGGNRRSSCSRFDRLSSCGGVAHGDGLLGSGRLTSERSRAMRRAGRGDKSLRVTAVDPLSAIDRTSRRR